MLDLNGGQLLLLLSLMSFKGIIGDAANLLI